MNDFIKSVNNLEDSYTPPNLLKKQKPFILIDIPFCDGNANKSLFVIFVNFINQFKISIKWIENKVPS